MSSKGRYILLSMIKKYATLAWFKEFVERSLVLFLLTLGGCHFSRFLKAYNLSLFYLLVTKDHFREIDWYLIHWLLLICTYVIDVIYGDVNNSKLLLRQQKNKWCNLSIIYYKWMFYKKKQITRKYVSNVLCI